MYEKIDQITEKAVNWIKNYDGKIELKRIPDWILNHIDYVDDEENGGKIPNEFTSVIGLTILIKSKIIENPTEKVELDPDETYDNINIFMVYCVLERLCRLKLIEYEIEGDMFDKNGNIVINNVKMIPPEYIEMFKGINNPMPMA